MIAAPLKKGIVVSRAIIWSYVIWRFNTAFVYRALWITTNRASITAMLKKVEMKV
jgi:hypothetical protein